MTDAGEYEGDKLVLAPGAWITKLVPELEVGRAGRLQPQPPAACIRTHSCHPTKAPPPLRPSSKPPANPLTPNPHPHPHPKRLVKPQRVTVGWFEPSDPAPFLRPRLPVWLLQMPGEGPFYGFPVSSDPTEPGFKIGGWSSPNEPAFDPDASDRSWRGDADEAPLRAALARFFPGAAAGRLLRGGVCMFSNTPDGHFVVDVHPRHPQVGLCAAPL
jgi:glycine/D-amino acid oxidase-like deaminating enzyme